MRRIVPLSVLLLAATITLIPLPAQAATLTVDSVEDVILGNGNCSLREAITAASSNSSFPDCGTGSAGLDTINFDIDGAGPHVIEVSGTQLPALTDQTTIDGTSEPDYAGTPVVEVDGSLLGGGADGLWLGNGASGSTIKGLAIHSFPDLGISVFGDATGLTIQGNHIGTDGAGATDLGNGSDGLSIGTSGNTIGGSAAGAGNLISGNDGRGIVVSGGTSTNTVQGNLVGTDVAGTSPLGNALDGISVSGSDHVLGGAGAGEGNVIGAGGQEGIVVTGDGHVIEGNAIGTDAGGTVDLGNALDGIIVTAAASGISIGGTAAGEGNDIAFNGGAGIITFSNSGVDNAFLRNSIHDNAELGIDLANDGVTANDAGDTDSTGQANNLQNFPELDAVSPGSTMVDVTLDTDKPTTTFRIEVFESEERDPSGFGEGATFLGAADVVTDGAGDHASTINIGVMPTAGYAVAATATELDGSSNPLSTSEFSAVEFACTVTGTAGADDPLPGTAGNDVICGLGGDDRITASQGDDIIVGGDGVDEIDYSASPTFGADIDLQNEVATVGAKIDTLVEIEDATGTNQDDTIAGASGVANGLAGLDGTDTLNYSGAEGTFGVTVDLEAGMTTQDGDGGADTLAGFEDVLGTPRSDSFTGVPGAPNGFDGGGEGGVDSVNYQPAPGGVTVDLGTGMATDDGDGAVDTLTSIDYVLGSSFADSLTGGAEDDRLAGVGGDDTLIGGGGDDDLEGGNGTDTADYSGTGNGITVDLPGGTVDGGSTDTVAGVEGFVGTSSADTFIDEAGVDNTFDGGGGTDTVDYSQAPQGVDVDLGAGTTSDDGAGGTDTLTSLENVVGSSKADTLAGDDGANSLDGGDGGDTLLGGAGKDDLDGEAGGDTVKGEAGNDTLLGGTGGDTVKGGDGADTVKGEDGNDTVDGGDGKDTGKGGKGKDTVKGGKGNDTLLGNDGKDTLVGKDGKDTLKGGDGNDTLKGGDGKDTCKGGGGNDTLKSCEK